MQDPFGSMQARRRGGLLVALHSAGVLAVWGCTVQWRYGATLTYCMGVAAPGESLAGAGRPAATAPVGVAILLGSVVGNLTAGAPGSSTSSENLDHAAWSGGGVVFNVIPLFRAPS